MMDVHDFRKSTHDLRYVFDAALPFAKPALLGGRVLDASKHLARLLEQQVPDLKHSAALEVVAKAVGFQHWHELNTHVQKLIEDFPPDQPRPSFDLMLTRLAPFQRALALFVQVPDAMPPALEDKSILESTADAFSHNGIERTLALRALARMHGADSWNELLSRRPIDHPEPLYSFELPRTQHEGARFVWSPACAELVEEQDSMYQGYDSRSASEQRRLDGWVRETLQKRPDFLEGYLALTTVLEASEDTYDDAGPVYKQAIARAESLIASGFKGEVPWIWIDNRFYHRLLYGYMSWCGWTGKHATAVAQARKQLRRNKSDNLGVRLLLPSLLVAAGHLDQAHQWAEKRLRASAYDAGELLTLSIGCFAIDDFQSAKRDLLAALFRWPPLRLILSEADGTRALCQNTRDVIPDPQQAHFAYQIAARGIPIKRHVRQWLADRAVMQAETDLEALWLRANPDPRTHLPNSALVQQWRAEVLIRAGALASP